MKSMTQETSSQVPWQANTPVITLTPNPVNSLGLACGNGLGRVNPNAPVTVGNPANPAPCNVTGFPSNFQPDQITAWNLSVQHGFGRNLSLNIAYVGTHGGDLRGAADINQPAVGVKNGKAAPSTATEQVRSPFTTNCPVSVPGGTGAGGPCFPYLGQVNLQEPNEISNYDALQTTLHERLSHGLEFTAAYTFAHALDEASGVSNSSNTNLENTLNPRLDYGNAAFDARHHFTLTGTYNIPGHKAPGQMLEGWQVNVALSMLSGLPFDALDSTDDLSGTGILQDRWNILGNPGNIKAGGAGAVPCFGVPGSSFASSGTCITVAPGASTKGTPSFVTNMPAQCVSAAQSASISNGGLWNVSSNSAVPTSDLNYNGLAALASFGCYFQNGTAIVPAAQGTYGNMGRDVLRDRPFRETDLSVTKSWKFRERLTAQFRGEFFNIFNTVEYATPSANLAAPATFGRSASTPNTFSLIFGSGGPRTVQLGLKLIF